MAESFDLTAVLGKMATEVAAQNRMQIVYIPYERLLPDPKNGYSMDGVEELAGNIEMVGLQQPLVVNPETEDGYKIISGHRRYTAIGLIIKDGSQLFAAGVPCIVSAPQSGQDPEVVGLLGELKLLMANADNRKKNSADQNREAEGMERVVARLDALGYPFPGRRRDWVAKLTGMSNSKLARLKVIREGLEPGIKKKYYDKGNLGETVAYELAQLPKELQKDILAWNRSSHPNEKDPVKYLYAGDVESYAKNRARIDALQCPMVKGQSCCNAGPMIDQILVKSRWSHCHCRGTSGKNCCANCPDLASCKNVCMYMVAAAANKKKEIREQRKAERLEVEAAERPAKEFVRDIWLRFGNALARANMEEQDLKKTRQIYQIPEETVIALECGELDLKKIKANMVLPFSNHTYRDEVQMFTKLADVLGCSLDYLFLRTDVPELATAAAPQQAPKAADLRGLRFLDATPPLTMDGRQCWCWFLEPDSSRDLYFMARWHAETETWYTGERYSEMAEVDAPCLGWWPLPNEDDFDLDLTDAQPDAQPAPAPASAAPAGYQTGDPTEPGWYAVKVSYRYERQQLKAVFRWDGAWVDERGHKLLDVGDQVLGWIKLPEEE